MVKRIRVLCGLLALAIGNAHAADSISLTMPLGMAYGSATDSSDTVQGQLEGRPRLDVQFAPATSLVLSGRLRLDAEDRLEPGELTRDNYASLSRPIAFGSAGSLELRDFYLEHRTDRGIIRFGKQQIVWGRLDGLKVLDLVNPQDFREFILDDFDQSRIGLWSAYADYSFGPWRAELALVPDGTGHATPESNAWFELRAPRFRYGAPPDGASPPVTSLRPGHGINDAAAGLRLSRQFDLLDLSLVAYSGLDPEPLGRVLNTGVLERFYRRRGAFGFSAETAFGSLALRAEYAYQPKRVFNTRSPLGLGLQRLGQHRAGVGLDWNAPGDFFVNVQYLVDSVDDAPGDLVRPAKDRVATVFLRRTFAYDTLTASLRWYRSLEDRDHMASMTLEYDWTEETTLRISAETFGGSREGLFGQFSDRDRLTLGVEYTF